MSSLHMGRLLYFMFRVLRKVHSRVGPEASAPLRARSVRPAPPMRDALRYSPLYSHSCRVVCVLLCQFSLLSRQRRGRLCTGVQLVSQTYWRVPWVSASMDRLHCDLSISCRQRRMCRAAAAMSEVPLPCWLSFGRHGVIDRRVHRWWCTDSR
jgi:hypothetical protein